MSHHSRRRFLKQSAVALTAIGLPVPQQKVKLKTDLLHAVAEVVLPVSELKTEGVDRVLAEFQTWIAEFEPVAEQEHAYLSSSDIVYGPPDPAPRWEAQLEAIEIEAQKNFGKSFAALPVAERRRAIERAIRSERLESLPSPGEAQHVAVGLAAFFYSSTEANDMCYESAIGRQRCRAIETGPQKPAPLTKRG